MKNALLISLLIHVLFVLFFKPNFNDLKDKKNYYEVSLNDFTKNQQKKLAQNEKKDFIKDENLKGEKKIPTKADFEGKENISNEKQERAKNIAERQNKQATPQPKKEIQRHISFASPSLQKSMSDIAYNKHQKQEEEKQEQEQPSKEQSYYGPNDYVMNKDIKEGASNLLNVRESKYYTFFKRLVDKVEPIWKSDLNGYFRSYRNLPQEKKINARPGEYYTVLGVLMNAQGEIENITVLETSGQNAFDQIASNSFKEAKNFPNPPPGLIENDGKIKIAFGFLIRLDQSGIFFDSSGIDAHQY